ncbi:hypothetical protein SAMN05446589_10079 [Streptomyces sp. OV198]|nr:hypothetical protein SAMN05446589_10079 [Streptomyces sp. OV198]
MLWPVLGYRIDGKGGDAPQPLALVRTYRYEPASRVRQLPGDIAGHRLSREDQHPLYTHVHTLHHSGSPMGRTSAPTT